MERGDIWWADLPQPQGSEPGYERPILIVQSDYFNLTRVRTILTATLSSNLERATFPGNLLLPARETGLPHDSVVRLLQLVAVDRANLRNRTGKLPARTMAMVDNELRLVLAL